MRLYLFTILVLSCTLTNAQTVTFVKAWEYMYGSQSEESFYGGILMQQDKDGFIYIGSNSPAKYASGTKHDPNCSTQDSILYLDFWIIKIDTNGAQIWDRALGGAEHEYLHQLRVNNEGDKILLSGYSDSFANCDKSQDRHFKKSDGWFVILNADSNVIIERRLGSKLDDHFKCGAMADDGSIILAGMCDSYLPGYDVTDTSIYGNDILFFKVDSNGNKVWDQKYGGTLDDFVTDIIVISNNQYLVIGSTNGIDNGDVSDSSFSAVFDSTYYAMDNWIMKIDSSGQKIWDERYGCLSADDYSTASMLNSNGEIVIGATLGLVAYQGLYYPCNDGVKDTMARGAWDCWLYKLDTADGHLISEKRFGGDRNESICQIVETKDKGYLIACRSNSNAGYEKSENRIGNLSWQPDDFWIVRMDSAFNIIWDKTIGTEEFEWCPNIMPLSDSSFIIGGHVDIGNNCDVGVPIYDTASTQFVPKGDIWVAKWYIPSLSEIKEITYGNFSIYPNPAKDLVYITPNYTLGKRLAISAYSITGELIYQEEIGYNNTIIPLDISSWTKGVYILSINGAKKKIVKI